MGNFWFHRITLSMYYEHTNFWFNSIFNDTKPPFLFVGISMIKSPTSRSY